MDKFLKLWLKILLMVLLLIPFGLTTGACDKTSKTEPIVDIEDIQDESPAITEFGEYGYIPPPGEVPASLASQVWLTHLSEDILPFWTVQDALGTPPGNFPTSRGMDGTIQGSPERKPRMLSRQIYLYSVGYLMTGDVTLLEHAHKGVRWLLDHARDQQNGGWFSDLNRDGSPRGSGTKTAQDTSYCMLGLAAYFFVTRDAEAQAALLAGRDLLFNPDIYWDQENRRIRDGMNSELTEEIDWEDDSGWELVAQLDPINAFMLLSQPVLEDDDRRTQFLQDMKLLGESLIEHFWSSGVFWGVHSNHNNYGSRHVDFGHTLKSYWMILQIDKRLDDHPFSEFLQENVDAMMEKAYDPENGRWAKRMASPIRIEYGSDWWIYAESDQLAATLALINHEYLAKLSFTSEHFLEDYVDRNYPVRELIPGIKRDGSRVWNWDQSDTAKCNEWKNGYHSAEHGLIFYLLGTYLEAGQAKLYFAVPEDRVESFKAVPYIFEGEEVSRESMEIFNLGGSSLRKVQVSFGSIY